MRRLVRVCVVPKFPKTCFLPWRPISYWYHKNSLDLTSWWLNHPATRFCISNTISVAGFQCLKLDSSKFFFSVFSEPNIWCNMRGLKTTNALTYHWSQSQWNSHLYHTLKVDTRNIVSKKKKKKKKNRKKSKILNARKALFQEDVLVKM